MNQKELNKLIQESMNKKGESLVVDGAWGPKTEAAAEKYEFKIEAAKINVVQTIDNNYFGAPWVFANIDLLGRDETDHELNARYVPEWKLEGLSDYKTLVGNRHAWCSLKVNADLRKVGVKGTNSAAASSWSKWGRKSPFWFGSILDISHQSGGRHVCFFLYWIDEKKGICATMDGNKSNKFCIAQTTLSIKADKLVTGPRWSKDLPDGQVVSMNDVLKAHPILKVGSNSNGSTR